MQTMIPNRRVSQRGQMVAMLAVGATALIGTGGFVLDMGVAYQAHRRAQAAADASALGAAQLLPTSPSAAQTASAELTSSNLSEGTVTLTISTTYVANDTATATATKSTSAFLSKVLGKSSFTEQATSTAVAGSYTGWSDGLSPWVIDKQSIEWGQLDEFKVKPGDQASSGNFGGARLPMREKDCGLASGGNDYRNLISGSRTACMTNVGDKLNPETGNLTGPTNQGVNDRGFIQNFDPYSILKQQADGSYVLTTYHHPNLIVIPVIDKFHQGNSSPFTVVGFAWFIITSYTNNTVTGMFIGSEVPGAAKCSNGSSSSTTCPFGGYDPYLFKVIQLQS